MKHMTSIVFAYKVPVYVEVADGRIVSVKVDDSAPIDHPYMVDGPDEALPGALAVANGDEAWPAWGWV